MTSLSVGGRVAAGKASAAARRESDRSVRWIVIHTSPRRSPNNDGEGWCLFNVTIQRICLYLMVLLAKTSTLLALVAVIACTLCQVGCVSSLLSWKPGILRAEKKNDGATKAKPPQSGEKDGDTNRAAAAAGQGGAASVSSRGPAEPAESPDEPGLQAAARKEDRSAAAAGESTKDKPVPESDSDAERLPPSDDALQRHDHAGHLVMIKNRATDLLNKDRACTYARLCKNSITGEWSLTLYYQEDKTFRFVTYGWDQVDEKWDKSFTSEKRPIGQLNEHLKFTAVGKNCTELKKAR